MATVRPFKALRFTDTEHISSLVCPPYDIISEEERSSLYRKNQNNIVRLELPLGENAYGDAAELLKIMIKDGVLKKDECDSIYIYEERFSVDNTSYCLKGFISLVRLEEFEKGVVLPHEETLSKAKEDRYKLMQACGCNFSQVYSLYEDSEGNMQSLIDTLSNRNADVCFKTDDDITHSLWQITDSAAILKIVDYMKNKKLYIADGHHRYETALKFSKENAKNPNDDGELTNYVMMMNVCLENKGLVVFPTHRIVKGIENFDKDAVISSCKKYFDITPIANGSIKASLDSAVNKKEKAFVYYAGDGELYLFTLTDNKIMSELLNDFSPAYQNLDVSVLHSLVLERIFKIDKENMKNGKNLVYTRDIYKALREVDSKNANCCFIINATSVDEIASVATSGEKMPQKSTYFYPKLITGLVMNMFRD